jgi:hypothetical protein
MFLPGVLLYLRDVVMLGTTWGIPELTPFHRVHHGVRA